MTYKGFLRRCRRLASDLDGRAPENEFDQAEFASRCKKRTGESYEARYYGNMEDGTKTPGLELLEAAALAAGLKFQDCVQFPRRTSMTKRERHAIETFMEAIHDHRQAEAVDAAFSLEKQERKRRPKYGGRTRKKSESDP